MFFHFLKKIFCLQKIITYHWNWYIKIHPLRKKSIVGINLEKNFCFGLQEDFAAIVIVWKILEESHYGQLFYGKNTSGRK